MRAAYSIQNDEQTLCRSGVIHYTTVLNIFPQIENFSHFRSTEA